MRPSDPLLRWRRTRDGVDLTIGASAGKTLVRILGLLVAAGLLATGVVTWADVAESLRVPSPPRIDLYERPPSPRIGPELSVRGAREPPNRPSTVLVAPGRACCVNVLDGMATVLLAAHALTGSAQTPDRSRSVEPEERCSATRLEAEQRAQALANFGEHVVRSLSLKDHPPCLPVQVLYVIRQHDAADACAGRQRDLERISLDVAGDRAGHRQTCLCVVRPR